MTSYRAPGWLPGGHAQTIYAALLMRRARVAYRRERWETPDGDFIDLDWTVEPPGVSRQPLGDDDRSPPTVHCPRFSEAPGEPSAISRQPSAASGPSSVVSHQSSPDEQPLVVLFHGLEGSSRSHYALALMAGLRARGLRGVAVHFRGCSGEPNRLARAYHSGDAPEIDWIVRRIRARHEGALFAVGVSLGGNALLKWLGETGTGAIDLVRKAVAVSAPLDLMAAGDALGRGFNRLYTRNFLATLKVKALAKLSRHPGLYDAARVRAASTLREFDDLVTAPLHGFRDTDDYWTRASSKPGLRHIRVPTLVINARNDPFLPADALPGPDAVSAAVTLEQPEEGGHVGFVAGAFPGHLEWLPQRALDFFSGERGPEARN